MPASAPPRADAPAPGHQGGQESAGLWCGERGPAPQLRGQRTPGRAADTLAGRPAVRNHPDVATTPRVKPYVRAVRSPRPPIKVSSDCAPVSARRKPSSHRAPGRAPASQRSVPAAAQNPEALTPKQVPRDPSSEAASQLRTQRSQVGTRESAPSQPRCHRQQLRGPPRQ